jgi:transposase
MEKRQRKQKDPERVARGMKAVANREPTEAERPHPGREAFVARILAGERQTAIAKEAGVSRQRVGQWLQAARVAERATELVAKRLEARKLCLCRDALAGATVAELAYRFGRTNDEVCEILASARIMPKRGRREGGRKSPYAKHPKAKQKKQRSG